MAQFISGAVGTGKTFRTQVKIMRLVWLIDKKKITAKKVVVLVHGQRTAKQYEYEMEGVQDLDIPILVLPVNTSDIINKIDKTECKVIILFCNHIEFIIPSDDEIKGIQSMAEILSTRYMNYHWFFDDLQYFLWLACWYDSAYRTNYAKEVVKVMYDILNSDPAKSKHFAWFICDVVKLNNYINYSYMVGNGQLTKLLTLLQPKIPPGKVFEMSEIHTRSSTPILRLLSCVRSNIISEHRDNFPELLPELLPEMQHNHFGGVSPRLYAVNEEDECAVKEIIDQIIEEIFYDPNKNLPYKKVAILAERYRVDSLQKMLSRNSIRFTTEFRIIDDREEEEEEEEKKEDRKGKVWIGNIGDTGAMDWLSAIVIVCVSDSIYNSEVKPLLCMLYNALSRVRKLVYIVVLYSDGSFDTVQSLFDILNPHVVTYSKPCRL